MLRRRNLLAALALTAPGGIALAPPAGAAPPPGKVLRLGILDALAQRFDPESNAVHRALLDGLRAHGWVVGRNLVLEYRSAGEDNDRLSRLADELVQAKVDILVPLGANPALAVQRATTTIPIVMTGLADPVAPAVIASLARLRGKITGIAFNAAEIAGKRVQLLKEVVPNFSVLAVLWNSSLKTMA